MIFNHNHPLHDGLDVIEGYAWLRGYKHKLPVSLKAVNGNLDLGGYKHPLPDGLEIINGWLWLSGYDQPLPKCLNVKGEVIIGDYDLTKHELPEQLAVKVIERFKCFRDNHETPEVFHG